MLVALETGRHVPGLRRVSVGVPLRRLHLSGGRLERLEVQDVLLKLQQRACNSTAPAPLLRIQRHHTRDCLIEVVAVLLFEDSEEGAEAVLTEFQGRGLVDIIAVLEGAAREDGESDAEDFSEGRVDVGGIGAFLDEFAVDLFGGEEDGGELVFCGVFDEIVVVGGLVGERGSADDFDLSALVDEDVLRVHVAYLFLEVLELAARTHDVVQQIPHFGLEEVLLEFVAVHHFGPQHKLIVVER